MRIRMQDRVRMRPAGDEYGSGDEILGWGCGEDLLPRNRGEEEGVPLLCTDLQEIERVDEAAACFTGVCRGIFAVELPALRDRPPACDKDPHQRLSGSRDDNGFE